MQEREKDSINTTLLFPMIILAVVRVLLSVLMGIWFPAGQIWDDQLMIKYAMLSDHFKVPTYYSVIKNMSYSVLVNFLSHLGLPFPLWLGIFWVMAAFFVYFLVRKIFSGKKAVAFFAYVYTLFLPQAFDAWSGTRLYRTQIIAPFTIVTVCLLVWSILYAVSTGAKKYISLILLGLFFTFTYYIKEDGIWLMACLLFSMVVGILSIVVNKDLRQNAKKLLLRSLEIFIPLVLFIVLTLGYKAVNYKYFGVFEINTRTGSEYGKFMANVYKAESENRTRNIWTPADAIVNVFNASPTLMSKEGLLEEIIDTPWYETDIYEHPIPGDILAYILRDALHMKGYYTSEKDILELFKAANKEIDAAYKNGTLKKQKGVVQILSSTGGYTVEEVKGLFSVLGDGFKGAVLLDGYAPGIGMVSVDEIWDNEDFLEQVEDLIHVDYLQDYKAQTVKSEKCSKIIIPLIKVYKVINVVLLAVAVLSVVYVLIRFLLGLKSVKTFWQNRYKMVLKAMAVCVFLGIAVFYAFSIGWFSSFLFEEGVNMLILNYYNIALPGLLMFAYVFGISVFAEETELIKRRV